MAEFNRFDGMAQDALVWIDEIARDMGPDATQQDAYLALRSVLHMTRDRIPMNEAVHLSAQFPTIIRGVYFEHYKPTDTPKSFDTTEEFANAVEAHLQMEHAPDVPSIAAIRSVFKVMAGHIASGQTEQVIHMFPKEMRHDLFPDSFVEAAAQ